MKNDEINAAIGRSADFYGPHTRISDRFFQGAYHEGVAMWMGNPDVLRTLSYTLDNAKALAILGNDNRANQQVWHMPAAPAMTGVEFISLASKLLDKELRIVTVPGPKPEDHSALLTQMPEIAEMMYQYEYPYIFDSSKFQQAFGMKPTSYEEGFMNVFNSVNYKN
jgi:nucleoside-diphosphate-sugar epimerase